MSVEKTFLTLTLPFWKLLNCLIVTNFSCYNIDKWNTKREKCEKKNHKKVVTRQKKKWRGKEERKKKKEKKSLDSKRQKTKNKILVVPSFLSGLKIRIAGRLMTQPVIPRRTVYTTFRGTSSKGKINFSDTARFTNKNKRGAYTISITAGQNFI